MPARRTTILLAGLLILVALAVGALLAGRRGTELPAVRLADGSTVRVAAWSVGRQHFSPYESPAARFAAMLPFKLPQWLPVKPAPPAFQGWAAQSLAVWLEWDRLPPAALSNASPSSPSFLLCLHDGRPFLISSLQQTAGRRPDGRYFEGYLFPPPPPAIPQVKASLFPRPQWGGDEPESGPALAEWTLEPRVPAPRAQLVAQPLPQTRRLDDLEVTLQSLVLDADGTALAPRVMPTSLPSEAWSFARFALRVGDGPATDWQVERISSLTDAFGTANSSISWNNGHDYIRWRWPLWPDQPWKLAVEFTRTNGFAANEVWTVTGLQPHQRLSNPATLATGTIQSVELMPSNWDPNRWQIEVGFTPLKAPGRLSLVSAMTADGEPVKGSRQAWGDNNTTFHLETYSTNRGALTVTLALQLGRVAEFVVEPGFLNPNAARR